MTQQPSSTLPRLLTAEQLSEQIDVPRWRVYELVRSDDLPCIRLGRALRFDAEAVRAWLAAGGTRSAERDDR